MHSSNRLRGGLWLVALTLLPFVAGATPQAEATDAGKPMDITWQFRYADSWMLQELNRKFNVNIISNEIWNNDIEKVDLMFASGDIPEVFSRGPAVEHYDEGLTRTIPVDMIKKHGPAYAKILDDHPWAWVVHKAPDDTNAQIALGGITMTGAWVMYYPAFRVDWARKLGIDIPGYDQGKVSLDAAGRTYFYDLSRDVTWWEKLLVAFRDGDPDGNGKIDTIPMGACNSFSRAWSAIIGSFGVNTWDIEVGTEGSANYLENGEVVLTITSERYRTFLRWMARWYQMRLIDSEFPSLSNTKMWEKMVGGKIGVSFGACVTDVGVRDNRPPGAFVSDKELGTGAEVVMTQLPIGPDGFQFAKMNNSQLPAASHPIQIRHNVSDAKTRKIIELYDYFNCTLEGWVGKMYGKEGVHFDWSGKPMASAPTARNQKNIPEGYPKIGAFVTYPAMYLYENFPLLYPEKLNTFIQSYSLKAGLKYATRPYKWDQFSETGVYEAYSKYGEGLNSLAEEFFYKAITGSANLESDWNSYVAKFKANGGDEYLAALRKAPILSELLKGNAKY